MNAREFEDLKNDIEKLKSRKIRGEEQYRILTSQLKNEKENILKLTDSKTIEEAREKVALKKKELEEKKKEFSEKYREFKKEIELI